VNSVTLKGKEIIEVLGYEDDGLFCVDFEFRGFINENFGVGELGGGFIMYVGAIGVRSVMGASLILGHLRDQAAWAPPQWRHLGVSASQLLMAWVSRHLGHAGLLVQAVAWWPS
jgi:hypothetical protein